MKLHLANYNPGKVGGGWKFADNFVRKFPQSIYEAADIYFIAGATLVEREVGDRAKSDGKKIVLRIDNAVRNSNNRGTGMSRLKDFSDMADLVIYQSKWARSLLYPFIKKDGPVILNGVDINYYNAQNREDREHSYLYCRSSRDEGKGWIMAWYWFVNNPGHLDIVGKFSPENADYNFDFYNNEKYKFFGVVSDMLPFYKRNKYFLYTYLNDACSNTLLEARASGMTIVDCFGMLKTGGAPEIMQLKDLSLERMASEYEQALRSIV